MGCHDTPITTVHISVGHMLIIILIGHMAFVRERENFKDFARRFGALLWAGGPLHLAIPFRQSLTVARALRAGGNRARKPLREPASGARFASGSRVWWVNPARDCNSVLRNALKTQLHKTRDEDVRWPKRATAVGEFDS